jgi:membrane-associated protease RseP (regulator of RpoE activity)
MSPAPDPLLDDAAAWVAGDLEREERPAFAERLRRDPAARREVEFWQRVRPAFADPARAGDGLGPGFAAAVLARAAREQPATGRQVVIRLPLWSVGAIAAAAAALVVALLLPSARPTGGMWLEDGSAVALQARGGDWSDYMPRALVHQVSHHEAAPAATPARERPWLGLWTRPVDVIDEGVANGTGHLVLRVVSGSPAARIGLRPGDVISSLDDCPLFSTQCIAHHLDGARPGDTVMVDWFTPSTGVHSRKPLTLEAVYE